MTREYKYLRRFYEARPYAAHLNRIRADLKRAGRSVDDKERPAVLLHAYNRIAGNRWINLGHPFWQTVELFLSDIANNRTPQVHPVEMQLMIEAARIDLPMNATVRTFLDRLGRLVSTKETPDS